MLCCPLCYGVVVNNGRCLCCKSCTQAYPIIDGIPDMRVYESPLFTSEFNKHQALYEAALHDEEAESDYEESVIRTFGTKTRLMVENWAMEIDKTSSYSVLDYGCGTGQVSRVMVHHIKPLFAFDISEKSLRKNMRENGVLGVLGNSLYLPFKERAFDIVCINGVLHHIVDLERAICELSRVSATSIYVSEGIPRGRPSFSRIPLYPRFNRRFAFCIYLVIYWFRALLGKGKTGMKRLASVLFRFGRGRISKSHGSKYERPLDVFSVESLMVVNGFKRNRLLWYTNIDIPGDGTVKKLLTGVLVNDVAGTHFDLRMDRDFANCAESVPS